MAEALGVLAFALEIMPSGVIDDCDTNSDGKATTTDALKVLRQAVGVGASMCTAKSWIAVRSMPAVDIGALQVRIDYDGAFDRVALSGGGELDSYGSMFQAAGTPVHLCLSSSDRTRSDNHAPCTPPIAPRCALLLGSELDSPLASSRLLAGAREEYHDNPLPKVGFSWYDIFPVIERLPILRSLRTALKRSRVVVLAGPRQCGKTTMARELLSENSLNYFDLEDPTGRARLQEPLTALQSLEGLVVIDEIQRRPDLFEVLRVLADRRGTPARFLVLGSASGELLRQTSESLAGRVERIVIGGFSLGELGANAEPDLWRRGGFPLSYLAVREADSVAWRKNFIQTLLERDLPQWGVRVPAVALQRLWSMLAHYHGQPWNAAEPARAMALSESTVRRYLDLLTDAFMIRQLHPWHANIRKRQVKAPKVYVRDSGLLHQLLGIATAKSLMIHPKVGASWEGFVIEQVLMKEPHDEAFFWATHQGAEIDLILRRGDELLGVECKRADAPAMTPSIRIACDDVGLSRVAVVYPGSKRYPIADKVEAIPLAELARAPTIFGPASR